MTENRNIRPHDTGIGIEAGYANDAEFMEACEAERAALDSATRAMLDEIDARIDDAFLRGMLDSP